ncbi:hypothetical protein [Kutzneria chonburiensis]|uniref:Secreted protein n=1 Tax=Kutzneria chonburiensis TaxID=1483604 RepID=A0ABV6N0Z3_9PSEU|nr:hypothetical protein [Kutzneria chonburiensis]
MRKLIAILIGTGALLGGAFATPAQASVATPASSSCTQDIGDPTGLQNVSTVRSTTATHGGRTVTVELRHGFTWGNNVEYAWTRIGNARPGDGMWLDITRDSQATHATCGSTSSPVSGQAWTHAFQTSSLASTAMRACGGVTSNGTVYFNCTNWW